MSTAMRTLDLEKLPLIQFTLSSVQGRFQKGRDLSATVYGLVFEKKALIYVLFSSDVKLSKSYFRRGLVKSEDAMWLDSFCPAPFLRKDLVSKEIDRFVRKAIENFYEFPSVKTVGFSVIKETEKDEGTGSDDTNFCVDHRSLSREENQLFSHIKTIVTRLFPNEGTSIKGRERE